MTPLDTVYTNPAARSATVARPTDDVLGFHQRLPGYAPTPLVELPAIARELGAGRVFLKDESSRLGLPAFKVLGASYAISRALSARWGSPDRALGLDELRERAAAGEQVRLFAATDGNHGRAVAHVARLIGLPATIYFPSVLTPSAKAAIQDEGAEIVDLAIPYDDVVARMVQDASAAGPDALVVQDTAWPGYEDVPGWIVDGYSTLLDELDLQLAEAGASSVELVMAPAGVGSLAQAIVTHYRSVAAPPSVTVVEPTAAPTIYRALNTGEPAPIETGDTIMMGLNCGTPSALAWPVLSAGVDASVLVTDDEAKAALRDLAALGVDAGPCGAATLAGARRVLQSAREHVGMSEDAVVVLVNTESRSANPVEGIV